MPDNLEAQLRDALDARGRQQSAEIPAFPQARPARLRTAALAGASALVVLALVIGGVLIFGRGSSGGHDTAGGASYAGTSWTLSALTENGTPIQLPAKSDATLAFPSRTDIGLNDSVNYLNGKYDVTSSGFSTHDIATTLAAYGGSDPNVVAMIAAIDAIGYRENAEVNMVDAHRQGGQLVVNAGKYQLTFDRGADVAPSSQGASTTAPASSANIGNGARGTDSEAGSSPPYSGPAS
jgi:hypothetical protein